MENPNNFLVNTDYPFDMIVYFKEYEFTTTSSTNQSVTIPHSLGFTPLLFGSWSDKQDFADSFTLLDEAFGADKITLYVEADSSNIYINKYQHDAQPGKKLYLKIYGFAPTTWTGDCEPTANTNSFLLLNTDVSYVPLLAAGAVQPRRLDVLPEVPTPEQTGIYAEIGKKGYAEIDGRSATVSLYYQEPISAMVMLWKETASTGRVKPIYNASWTNQGFPVAAAPYATYNSNTGTVGGRALAITIGTTRTGMPNYNDTIHFRVYA